MVIFISLHKYEGISGWTIETSSHGCQCWFNHHALICYQVEIWPRKTLSMLNLDGYVCMSSYFFLLLNAKFLV